MTQWRHTPNEVIRKFAEIIAEAKCATREGRKSVREVIRDDYLYGPTEGEVRS